MIVGAAGLVDEAPDLRAEWIQGFAYRTNIGPAPFLLAGLLVLGIALVSITIQTVKAATSNPIDSLRYE
jgi:putative ABC transport system permease protein